MLASIKKYRTFASYFAKVCFNLLLVSAFFIDTVANNIGYQFLSVCYTNTDSKCTLASMGGDSHSYFYLVTNNFIRYMPKYSEIVNATKNSTCNSTPNSATTVTLQTTIAEGFSAQSNNGNIKIVYGISQKQIHSIIKSLLKEFIDNGLVTLSNNHSSNS